MAIAIEGFSVVGLRQRIDDKYEGSIAALTKAAPNATAFADDDLWRCAFMAQADADAFLQELREAGMEIDGPDSDFVIVNEFDRSVAPYCEWLQVAQWHKGVIAWLAGTELTSLVAHPGWSPEQGSGLVFAESGEGLEFVGMRGDLEVYRNEAGEEVYLARTNSDPDTVFQVNARVIQEHFLDNGHAPLQGDALEAVRAAAEELAGLLRRHPDSWKLHFFLGKARQAMGDPEAAYTSFRTACELEHDSEYVARELVASCLWLGRGEEAVRVGEKAAAMMPDDPGTLGNLACAYLIAARLPEAGKTIQAALRLDPGDPINQRLGTVIREVVAGRQVQPRSVEELMRRATRP